MIKTIIISGSSDIGKSIIKKYSHHKIIATFNRSKIFSNSKNIKKYKLDINNLDDIKNFVLRKDLKGWNNLIILPATQNPIGNPEEINPEDWISSININFTHQIYLLLSVLKLRSKLKSTVVFWAGAGTNNAPKYYSAYIISKIALIKSTEIFNEEIKDTKFLIIGPGWVKTKIHLETLNNKKLAHENYETTKFHFKKNIFNSMKKVVNCLDTLLKMDKNIIGGRNISVQFDKWGSDFFADTLNSDSNIYKLRRDFNDFSKLDKDFMLDDLLNFFHKNPQLQSHNSLIFRTFEKILKIKINKKFFKKPISFLGFNIVFPYVSMGNINSTHLFGIDELFLFKFYASKKKIYNKVCDIGANIGLHSLILSKLNFIVDSFEPDPNHVKIAKNIFQKNNAKVNIINSAVSNFSGKASFTRILGNTTGSFIGKHKTPYGKLKIFKVPVISAKTIVGKYDLYKIDAEGSEIEILSCFSKKHLINSDFVMEISTKKNQEKFWQRFSKLKINIYSQKNSWKKVLKLSDLPSSHKEGSIIISQKKDWWNWQ
jgi:FkbM family methyltransferase